MQIGPAVPRQPEVLRSIGLQTRITCRSASAAWSVNICDLYGPHVQRAGSRDVGKRLGLVVRQCTMYYISD